ncbi:MAG: YceI family protein [Acidobacteria bacterium]|jgi:polyisoprenoid-binding protein YceI|nr:YceI family protein [Acidobacteriota bacterium]
MLFKKIFIGFMLFLFVWQMGFALQEFKSDAPHSSIYFTIRHMMVSKVKGHFKDFEVRIMADTEDITKSKVDAVIKAASIDTDNEDRDKHLRGADFFDVEKYPEITFKSIAVKKKDNDHYELWGSLTMHGVSKNIIIPFEILGHSIDSEGIIRVGIQGNVTLNRKDFNISYNQTLDRGGLALGDDVAVEILLELLGKR